MTLQEERQEAIEEIEGRRGFDVGKALGNVKPIYWLLLFILIMVGIYLVNSNILTGNQLLLYVIGAAGIIFIFMIRREGEGLLRESVVKKIVEDNIMYKIKFTEELSPNSEFKVCPHCRLIWREEFGAPPIPAKWEVKVTEFEFDGNIKIYTWWVHPIKGNIIGIIERHEGFFGTERGDTKLIMPPDYTKFFPPYVYEQYAQD